MGNFLIFFLLTITLTLGADDGSFIFATENIEVEPNEEVHLDCGIKGEYRYCVWEHGNDIFQVEEVHEGKDPGKSKPFEIQNNQCGIVIDRLSVEDYGNWTCKIFIIGGSHVKSKNVVRKSESSKVTTIDTTKKPVTLTRELSTPKPYASTTENTGLSAGIIVIICIVCVVVAALIAASIYFRKKIVDFFKKHFNKPEQKDGKTAEMKKLNPEKESHKC